MSDASSQLVSNCSSGCHLRKKKKTLMLIVDDDDDVVQAIGNKGERSGNGQ